MNEKYVYFISSALLIFNLINNDVNLLIHTICFIMLFKVLMLCIATFILFLIK